MNRHILVRRRRGYLDKQLSENSSLISGDEREGLRVSTEPDLSDRVRFDDNVSFIEAETQETETDHTRLAGKVNKTCGEVLLTSCSLI